jgi:putative FmdB family regulatory protein
MPIYAYRCERCGHELDALQKISDPALTDCPACGAASLQKKLTAPGFQLKGSGWYQTDFRGGAKPAAAAATDAPSETKAESKTGTKSDAPAPSTGCGSGCSCH